jgi:hypothetical protein
MAMSSGDQIFEPCYEYRRGAAADTDAQLAAGCRITRYLARCADDARSAFAASAAAGDAPVGDVTDAIIRVLLDHEFNHQAKGRASHLLPELRSRIGAHVAREAPIQLFMSYNGGYHASTCPELTEPLGFAASTAELLLLTMIARLKRRLRAVHPPGMIFHIVLNNGVAHDVNDIPLARTEGYARRLRAMIAHVGGTGDVRVLVQSELGDAAPGMNAAASPPAPAIDAAMHRNIERFLGRRCTEAEAQQRLGRYAPAEAAWWDRLRGIIAAADGVRLLQVASADFLSFRPFPGGATRAQTGKIGFRLDGSPVGGPDGGADGVRVVPVLVTTQTFLTRQVLPAPVRWPLDAPAEAMADA